MAQIEPLRTGQRCWLNADRMRPQLFSAANDGVCLDSLDLIYPFVRGGRW